MSGARVFVYYRVAKPRLAGVVDGVRAMQAALADGHPGLVCELLRRPQPQHGEVTLMETYAGAVTPAVCAAIGAAASRAGLPQPRHSETFEPLDPAPHQPHQPHRPN